MLPTPHPTRAQRARGKQTSQQATDDSFAAYFESQNLPVPTGLGSSSSNNVAPRTRKRQRVGDELDIDGRREDHQLHDFNASNPGASGATDPLLFPPAGNTTDVLADSSSFNENVLQSNPDLLNSAAGPSTNDRQADDAVTAGLESEISELRVTAEFINSLRSARLEDSNMDPNDIERLRNPPTTIPDEFNDKHSVKALKAFLAVTNASEATYNSFRAGVMECYPDDPFLSFDQVQRRIQTLSGISPILHDMCPESCAAFTGPYSKLTECPVCSSPRYHAGTQHPQRQFTTIPLGPVIQAMYQLEDTATQMHYRDRKTEEILEYARNNGGQIKEYDDTMCGRDYLEAWQAGKIKKGDILLQLSWDGAQLYRDKESDCLIFMFLSHNPPPCLRHTKNFVVPGGTIPGPNKPKLTESFLYPALYHISALQNEGLKIWDASTKTFIENSIPHLGFGTADGPAMANMTGMVGHSGKYGCRLYCGMPGRHRQGDPHYYPIMKKPNNYEMQGCDHDDVTLMQMQEFRQTTQLRYTTNLRKILAVRNNAQYKKERLATGLAKQTIFSGLRYTLGIPNIFVMDVMHLIALNDPDLLIGLWHASPQMKVYAPDSKASWEWAVLVGAVWDAHGQTVAMAKPYLPSSFGRAPRNLALKINSGYKAWEFMLYLFGLGPALLHSILEHRYWRNYCKFVRGVLLLYQRKITPEHVRDAHRLLCEFAQEFEDLYIQRKPERMHFLRQSIHLLTHMGPETIRAGPLISYSQWTMESLIGNLGREIRQDKDPYANIAQRALMRAQMIAIKNIVPGLIAAHDNVSIPAGSKVLGDGFILLHPHETALVDVSPAEASAIMELWDSQGWQNKDSWPRAVKRWARLQLPNGQVARSRWTELKSQRPCRRARIVKFCDGNNHTRFADIHYFFCLKFDTTTHALAVGTLFSEPDADLLNSSYSTVYACKLTDRVNVFNVQRVEAVVAMIPYFKVTQDDTNIITPENEYFLLEKPGLEITQLLDQTDINDDDFDTMGDTDTN